MADRAFASPTVRRWLAYAGLLGLAVVAIVNLGEISQLGKLLKQAHWYLLPLVIMIQAISYLANALYYRSFLKILGYDISRRRLFEAALAVNFVNQAFPSGGISGASFLSRELSGEVPAGKATLTQVWRYVLTGVGFLAVLLIGFLLLFLTSSDTRISLKLALLLILGVVVAGFVPVILVGDRAKMEKVGRVAVGIVNGIGKRLTRKKRRIISTQQLTNFLDEFYHGYKLFMRHKGRWWWPFIWTVLGSFAEVATVYAVFLAFGTAVNPGLVIAGYGLANLAGLAAFATGGIGVFEAAMIGAFVTMGLPFSLSFSVTITYRILNFILFLPPGFYFYKQKL
jgi:glycosyltransferase 2 family protein